MEDIDEVLGFEDLEHDFTHFKDRMLSIEMVQSHIGGVREGRSLNTTTFPSEMSYIHHDVQSVHGEEDDHHQQC